MEDSSLEVKPEEWMLPNRTGFAPWMYQTFHQEKYPQLARKDNQIALFPNQRLVRDYMQFDSPYRSILLYHGLGVGKTCASIAAAEGFLARHKKIFVLVPASLADNYKNEILLCATIGSPQEKMWSYVEIPENSTDFERVSQEFYVPEKYIKSRKGKVWIPSVPVDMPHVKRRDVAWNQMSEADREEALKITRLIIENRYQFISYNGISQKNLDELGQHAFDDAFIVMDETHNFISRVVNGGKIAKRIFNMMMNSVGSKKVFLSGTPIINHPFELSVLLNLVRGACKLYEYDLLKSGNMPAEDECIEKLQASELFQFVDLIHLDLPNRKIMIQLLPYGYVRGEVEGYIVKKEWTNSEEDVEAAVHQVLQKSFRVGKRRHIQEVFALPDRKEDFNTIFLDDADPMNPKVLNRDLFMRRILGLVSYFRSTGEEFPMELPMQLREINMTPFQFSTYDNVRDKERRMEKSKKFKSQIAPGLFQKKGTVYRAFSRMACNFVFPETIKRPFPNDIRKQLERELSANKEDQPEETKSEEEAKEKVNDSRKKETKQQYDVQLKDALNSLRESESLSMDKLTNVYSPKFAQLLSDVKESPGSCLIYSQFRTVEGLGILRMIMEHDEFVEIQLEKQGKEWQIANAEEVLSSKYNNRRFIVFTDDREKTDLLLKIFNGKFGMLPKHMVDVLRSYGYQHNLYGELAKAFMISQSGAEGISLRNVRRVMIAEPFWNKVRIDQVIGRAFRTGSHSDLDKKDRDVQVFMYMSSFTEKQKKDNFTIRTLDTGMTSDQHIFTIAEKKNKIIQQFLDMMKQASVDCIMNSTKNKILTTQGIQCYSFPINIEGNELAFAPTLEEDLRSLSKQKMERRKRIQGRVVSRDNKKYVVVEGMSGLYDYYAYKEAGVLIPAI